MGGGTQFSTAKPLPQELLRALNHNLDEFDPSVGTWNHTCMKTHKLPAGAVWLLEVFNVTENNPARGPLRHAAVYCAIGTGVSNPASSFDRLD
jgi:hypothetical protein